MEAAPLKRLPGTVCGSRGAWEARWSPDGLVHAARGVSGDSREAGTETADFGGTWTGRRAARAGGRAAAGPGRHRRLRPRCAEGTALRREASVPCIAVSIHGGAAGARRRAHGTPAASRVTAVRRGRCPCVWASCGQGLGSRAGQRLRRRAVDRGDCPGHTAATAPPSGGRCLPSVCWRRVFEVRARRGGRAPGLAPLQGCGTFRERLDRGSRLGHSLLGAGLPGALGARERSCCGRGRTRTRSSPLRRCSVVFPAGARLLRAPATTAHEEAAVAMHPEPAAGGSGSVRGSAPAASFLARPRPAPRAHTRVRGTPLDAVPCLPATVTPRPSRRGEPGPSAVAAWRGAASPPPGLVSGFSLRGHECAPCPPPRGRDYSGLGERGQAWRAALSCTVRLPSSLPPPRRRSPALRDPRSLPRPQTATVL